jgi:hypothetical protein
MCSESTPSCSPPAPRPGTTSSAPAAA